MLILVGPRVWPGARLVPMNCLAPNLLPSSEVYGVPKVGSGWLFE
jgi:hypothetical protein